MIYYFGKFFQAMGLAVILIGFLQRFPALMNPKWLMAGLILFGCGWLMERFLLRKS